MNPFRDVACAHAPERTIIRMHRSAAISTIHPNRTMVSSGAALRICYSSSAMQIRTTSNKTRVVSNCLRGGRSKHWCAGCSARVLVLWTYRGFASVPNVSLLAEALISDLRLLSARSCNADVIVKVICQTPTHCVPLLYVQVPFTYK